jgi:trans-aconitate methyltransferase
LHNEVVTTSQAGTADHWDEAYGHGDTTRSWYQNQPAYSLQVLDRCDATRDDSLIDVGGGAATLVDALLARGHTDLSVLDISAAALSTAQHRLDGDAARVQWLVADLLTWQPERTYDAWHDRAVFHFLTTQHERRSYLRALEAATASGALLVIATFAPEGPSHCSGLPVARYSARDLAAEFGDGWRLLVEDREEHTTPSGAVQPFTWVALRRS